VLRQVERPIIAVKVQQGPKRDRPPIEDKDADYREGAHSDEAWADR